jgi:fumarylacetoacetase
MIYGINETHDPRARSWVETANVAGCDFPIQNLPFGVFERDGRRLIGVAIGDQVLDLAAVAAVNVLKNVDGAVVERLERPNLNALMNLCSLARRVTSTGPTRKAARAA